MAWQSSLSGIDIIETDGGSEVVSRTFQFDPSGGLRPKSSSSHCGSIFRLALTFFFLRVKAEEVFDAFV